MPKCNNCDTHFKFSGDKVCWLIKEQIGDNICQNCKREYLNKMGLERIEKQYNIENNGKNISRKND